MMNANIVPTMNSRWLCCRSVKSPNQIQRIPPRGNGLLAERRVSHVEQCQAQRTHGDDQYQHPHGSPHAALPVSQPTVAEIGVDDAKDGHGSCRWPVGAGARMAGSVANEQAATSKPKGWSPCHPGRQHYPKD